MRQAVGLQRVKAFEIQEGLDKALGRGVAFHHRGDVGAQRPDQPRLGLGGAVEGLSLIHIWPRKRRG